MYSSRVIEPTSKWRGSYNRTKKSIQSSMCRDDRARRRRLYQRSNQLMELAASIPIEVSKIDLPCESDRDNVNHIRHHAVLVGGRSYDDASNQFYRSHSAFMYLRNRILRMISDVYPDLAKECQRQIM